MGYVFEYDMELLMKELPKYQDGVAIDLSSFSKTTRKCARQLLDLVEANKKTTDEFASSFWTQTQAP
jgi:hypothetical protein